jgi:ribosomal protein S12 methylthiotransferase
MKSSALKTFHQERIKQALRVGMISLGCARNTVDSETIIAGVTRKGYAIADAESADIVIVNTCGFIEAAKKESLDVIGGLAKLKKQGKIQRIVVAGCLAQRYAEELRKGFPEVDAFVGVLSLNKNARQTEVSLTPSFYSYLKICESCYNQCSFCAIPNIKGKFTSRTIESIVDDVRRLDGQGIRELNIVGQDITAYGYDLFREKRLATLLREICRNAGNINWVRLLYTYPAHVTDELLDVIAEQPKICKYMDMPLQHINDRILTRMNRNITRAQTEELIRRIRRKIPGVSLRTTFIVGFPGETDKDFAELLQFIQDFPFERAGGFTYSREDGTKASTFSDRVSAQEKELRLKQLMQVQDGVAGALQEKLIGRTLKVLIEDVRTLRSSEDPAFVGRSEYDAPDVDGSVIVRSGRILKAGDFIDVRITGAAGYDLEGLAVPGE